MRFKGDTIQRVSESLDRNAILESSPSAIHDFKTYEKIMNLRPRDRKKEIHPDMRYQAKSNVEKVIDNIQNRNALASVKAGEVVS